MLGRATASNERQVHREAVCAVTGKSGSGSLDKEKNRTDDDHDEYCDLNPVH
jgi:hypothetical protein